MKARIASAVYLITAVVIGFGAYGHGFVGRLNVDRELDRVAIAPDVYTILYVVWYFVSGCMLLFGVAAIWAWLQWRRGHQAGLFVGYLVALLYLGSGIGGFVYRQGDHFMLFFVALGLSLGGSTLALRTQPTNRA